MPTVLKDYTLEKKKREPMAEGVRVPELDKECPSCRYIGHDSITFAYRRTVSGKSSIIHWCWYERKEIPEEKK